LKKKIKFFFDQSHNIFFCDGGAGRKFCKIFSVGGSEKSLCAGGILNTV
jgi:hypothetical protein